MQFSSQDMDMDRNDKTFDKEELIEHFRLHQRDTGSADVQIATLTYNIQHFVNHLRTHKSDHQARLELTILVGKRRTLIQYLKRTDSKRYIEICKKLGLDK